MRRASLLLLALAACRGPDFVAPTGDDPLAAPVTVHGVVLDSVTRVRLPGVTVGMGGKFAVTDGAGSFTLLVAPGANSIHVSASGYEAFARILTVGSPAGTDAQVEVPLRRLAPFPVSCQLGASGFQAVIIDLQGRKSLERWSESQLTLVTGAATRVIPAINWGYRALDALQWQVTIPDADPSTDRVDWVLFDSQGDAYRGSCEPVAAPTDSGGP